MKSNSQKFDFRKLQTLSFSGLILILLLISFACKDEGPNPAEQEFVLPESNVTYSEHLEPFFLAKCGSRSGCHGPTDKAGGLDITSYTAIREHLVDSSVGDVILVIPGDGENSFLYNVLIKDFLDTPRMPLDGPYLNQNNVNGVKIWIEEGALFSAD